MKTWEIREKNGRKNKAGTYNITLMSAANYFRLPNLLKNKSWDITL